MTALLAALLLASTADEASLQKALDLYRGGEFEKALVNLDRLVASTRDSSVLGRAHLTRGQCFAALQRFDKVDAAFTRALEADPEISLDPSRVQPAIVSLLDAARERLRGELEVSGPPETEVLLDGRVLGRAPLRQSVGIGRHRVEWRAPAAGGRDVLIRAKEVTRIEIAPPPAPVAAAEPVPAAPAADEGSGLGAELELRATADPRDYAGSLRSGPVAPAPELAAGIGATHWSVVLGGMIGPAFGLTLRAAGRLPRLLGPIGLEGQAQGTLLFTSPLVGGAAALVGPTLGFTPWLDAFLGVGGGFLSGSSSVRGDYVLISLALRAHIRPK